MNTNITEKDLNGIDYLNGSGNVSKDGQTTNTAFKGALSRYNGSFQPYMEAEFIRTTIRQLIEYQMERFVYSNLPKGLDKYRLERKVLENGSALIVNVGDQYTAVRYGVETFNLYNEPVVVKIIEPLATALNGKTIDLTSNKGVVIRNNFQRTSTRISAMRFIKQLEKVLFQIEKNLFVSAPKGIINTKDGDIQFNEPLQNGAAVGLEQIINGQNTMYEYKAKSLSTSLKDNSINSNNDSLFIPIELTDRTESLITNYTYLKEQLKELVGASINIHQKKERAIQDEISGQQGFSTSALQHSFNIREQDIKVMNEKLGTNVKIEMLADIRPEDGDITESVEEVDNG